MDGCVLANYHKYLDAIKSPPQAFSAEAANATGFRSSLLIMPNYQLLLLLVTAGLDAHVKPIAWGKSRIANRLNCVIGRLQRKLKPM